VQLLLALQSVMQASSPSAGSHLRTHVAPAGQLHALPIQLPDGPVGGGGGPDDPVPASPDEPDDPDEPPSVVPFPTVQS
jgi:hypothetical protein